MSRSGMPSRMRRCAVQMLLLAAGSSIAGAQVHITFYESYPTAPPEPTAPFDGGAVICTATAAGTPTGFMFDFSDPATRAALCPGNPDRLSPLTNTFGARVTGNLIAPGSGMFALFLNTDDGNVLTINGVTVNTNWRGQASGPGAIGSIALHAGANPFVLDYFQDPPVRAFMELSTSGDVTVDPGANVVPEPGSVLLTATGLLGVLAVGRRRVRR